MGDVGVCLEVALLVVGWPSSRWIGTLTGNSEDNYDITRLVGTRLLSPRGHVPTESYPGGIGPCPPWRFLGLAQLVPTGERAHGSGTNELSVDESEPSRCAPGRKETN